MTVNLIEALKLMSGEQDENILSIYLDIAAHAIINRAYPYDDTQTRVPVKYEHNQLEIACYLLNKRGAEGQLSHNENGISRSYESGNIPPSMLKDIVPYCGSFKEVISNEVYGD